MSCTFLNRRKGKRSFAIQERAWGGPAFGERGRLARCFLRLAKNLWEVRYAREKATRGCPARRVTLRAGRPRSPDSEHRKCMTPSRSAAKAQHSYLLLVIRTYPKTFFENCHVERSAVTKCEA